MGEERLFLFHQNYEKICMKNHNFCSDYLRNFVSGSDVPYSNNLTLCPVDNLVLVLSCRCDHLVLFLLYTENRFPPSSVCTV